MLWWFGAKVLALTLAVPVIAWGHLRDKATKARRDPFCLHCGWTLNGLPQEGNCPECGRAFKMQVVEMFRRDPAWVIAYWRSAHKPPPVDLFNAAHPDSTVG